jgi:hypothetical protein
VEIPVLQGPFARLRVHSNKAKTPVFRNNQDSLRVVPYQTVSREAGADRNVIVVSVVRVETLKFGIGRELAWLALRWTSITNTDYFRNAQSHPRVRQQCGFNMSLYASWNAASSEQGW